MDWGDNITEATIIKENHKGNAAFRREKLLALFFGKVARRCITGSKTYRVGKQCCIHLHFNQYLRHMYTSAIGKSVNKQRVACDKIAESRYSMCI